ncbi:LolA family protein [Rubrivirga sp. IMCC45206]|uniref:LolA family protein n=1 Tax=Rubrivirga sp. IMCC45206 TaxID=3391614 RepID=UPI00398FC42D
MGSPLARALSVALLALAVGCAPSRPATVEAAPETPEVAGPVFAGPMRADPAVDAATLVAAIHARHAGSWYRTLTFTQRTSRRQPDGTISVETWREWLALPGRLRVEMDDPLAGTDVLFVGDTTYVYADGELAAARPSRNALLLWGFDAAVQDPAETLRIAAAEGVDVDAFRTDTFDGRAMYVLGTPASGEVWIERERLLFVRLVEQQGDAVQDVRFENYQRLGGGWIAPFVTVRVDGEIVFWETYAEMVADPALAPVLFDPRRWAEGAAASGAR